MSKETKKQDQVLSYQAVLYSDGSARPTNPGFTGWSVHGYVYSDKETTKGAGHPKVAPTPTGYETKDKKPTPIDVVNYYDYMGWSGAVSTNNAAEVMSVASALKYASTIENLKSVTVYCDNKYAVRGADEFLHQWVANGWKKRDGTDVQNQDEWRAVLDSVNALSANKTKIKVQWVKGHADNFGNVQADSLATIAGSRSMIEQKPGAIEQVKPANGYWKPDAERHPMLGLRGMLFNTDSAANTPGEYYLTNQVKSHEFIGRGEVGGCFGYVLTKTPDELLEIVRKRQLEQSREFTTLMLCRTDRVYDKAVCSGLARFGDIVLRRSSQHHLNMHFINERAMVQPSKKDIEEGEDPRALPITEELYPPKLALRCIEVISVLKGLTHSFMKDGDNTKFDDGCVFDLTDLFFTDTTGKDGVITKTFRKEIGVGDQAMVTRRNAFGVEMDFKLIFGIHLIPRNNLKRLEHENVRVWMVVQKLSPNAVRYHTVVRSGDDWCAFTGNSSNVILLKEPLV